MPYIGNYGDNSLLYFFNYQNAATGQPAVPGGLAPGPTSTPAAASSTSSTPTSSSGKLPSVSWIVAPEAYTEHPAWPAGYGAWYTAGVLNALTSDPEVWSKTALLITFDENDGFFDHVVGPYPNVGDLAGKSTVPLDNELFNGTAGTAQRRPRRRRRTVRPRRARAAAGRLALEHGRLGLLGDVRPHLADPLHRGAVRRRRAQHHALAAGRLRRPDLGVRLRERVRPRAAAAAASPIPTSTTGTASSELPPDAAGGRIGPDPGAGSAAVAPARLPLPRRVSTPTAGKLHLAVKNRGQPRRRPPGAIADGRRRARTATRSAPAIRSRVALANPGTYDLSLHGPNGFFRHFAGSRRDGAASRGASRRRARHADAPVTDRSATIGSAAVDRSSKSRTPTAPDGTSECDGTGEITIDTRHSGGWYDIALTTPSDPSFSYQLAGPPRVRAPD